MTCHIQEVRVDYQKWAFGALKSRTLWNIEKVLTNFLPVGCP